MQREWKPYSRVKGHSADVDIKQELLKYGDHGYEIEAEKAFYKAHPPRIKKLVYEQFRQVLCARTFDYYQQVVNYARDNPGAFLLIKDKKAAKDFVFKKFLERDLFFSFDPILRDCLYSAIGAYQAKGEYWLTTGQNTLNTYLTAESQLIIYKKYLKLDKSLFIIRP